MSHFDAFKAERDFRIQQEWMQKAGEALRSMYPSQAMIAANMIAWQLRREERAVAIWNGESLPTDDPNAAKEPGR